MYYTNCEVQYEATKTEEIPLNYFYDVNNNNGSKETCQSIALWERSANYSSYDIACFRSKINIFLNEKGQYCNVVSKRYDGKMRSFLEVYDMNGFVPITKETEKEFQKLADKCMNEYPNHMAVFNARSNIDLDDLEIQASWMGTVIQYLRPPNHIFSVNKKHDLDCIYSDGVVLANISERFVHKNAQIILEKWFRYTLVDLFYKGCIILNPEIDASFVRNWKLEKINDERLKDKHWCYMPSWKNISIAKQPTLFLQNIRAGDGLVIINNDIFRKCSSYEEAEDYCFEYYNF